MHHNTLGYSGTDGNSVWLHDNNFYDNSEGFSTDVFTAPGHPGFPQDSDLLEHNNFYSNNFNTYLPLCQGSQKPGPERTQSGLLGRRRRPSRCPVGTGMWIAGGNANVIRNNRFWDNWRRGTMLFSVPGLLRLLRSRPIRSPAATRPPTPPATSYRNQFYDNKMGQAPDGSVQPNGVDFWWDQGGITTDPSNSGNCWFNNTGKDGTAASVTGDCPRRPARRRTTCRPIAATAHSPVRR